MRLTFRDLPQIELEFVKPNPALQALATLKTSNAPVHLIWAGPYTGNAHASTSNAEAKITVPYAHKINLTHDAKTKKEAVIAVGEGAECGGGRGESELRVGSSNAEVVVNVTG